jgi:carboxynorspermidine decarboxylase
MTDLSKIPSPCYVIEEQRLRENLALIADVARHSGAEIIIALKACAMWSVFPVVREYVGGATASSVNEARLVAEEFGTQAHTYAPVYTEADFEDILQYSSHITFNSPAQWERFGPRALIRGVSCGLRVNPGWSPVETALYNPCAPGSRLGTALLPTLPNGVEGLHFHALCESSAEDLRSTLEAFESRFGTLLPQLKWVNMGGGHLMTRKGYDVEGLVAILADFRRRHPHLRIILEPGSAFFWQTGFLATRIEDVLTCDGVNTLMVDASFACHMPDCLEMPYKPAIRGAHDPASGEKRWRVGGNSCLAGDWCGDWAFEREPQVGDRLVFEDMIHYTMVKTTMFNGVRHPSTAILGLDGSLRTVREFGYADYRDRMG